MNTEPKFSVKTGRLHTAMWRESRTASELELPRPEVGPQRFTYVTLRQCICRRKDKIRLIISREAEKNLTKSNTFRGIKNPKHGDRRGLAQPNEGHL